MPTAVYQINCGGGNASPYVDGAAFQSGGGTPYANFSTITTTGVVDPAPQNVYQTEAYGNSTWTFGSLTPAKSYLVRLHYAELYWGPGGAGGGSGIGNRVFDVYVQSVLVADDFDIIVVAGNALTAIVQEYTAAADGSGSIVVSFDTVVDNAKISGIEIIDPGSGGGGTNTPVTISATQAQTVSFSRGAGRGRNTTQVQTPTRTRAAARPRNATAVQTATRLRAVAPIAKSVTNAQTGSMTKGQGYFKTLTATIAQTVVLSRALGVRRSLTQTQTLVRAVAIARALSAVETQSKAIARAIATRRAVTGAQAASLAKATNRLLTLTVTITQTAGRSRALGRALAVTANQTLTRVRALAKALNVTNAETPSVQVVPSSGAINYPMTLSATVSQTIALARACARPLSTLQSQSITRQRALTLGAKSASQTQVASAVKGQGYFKTLTATIAQAASRVRGVGIARSATFSQAASTWRAYGVTRTANANQTASRERALAVAKSANQTQTLTFTKGRGLFVTIAVVAIQIATAVKRVGLTRFGTQTQTRGLQVEVIAGGLIPTPALVAYCSAVIDCTDAQYTSEIVDCTDANYASQIIDCTDAQYTSEIVDGT